MLKAPSDYFYNLIKIHFGVFKKYFDRKPDIFNLKKKIMQVCILSTEKIDVYSDWSSHTNTCYEHRRHLLNQFTLLLIRKNCKWLTDKIASQSSNRNNKKERKLKILKT